VFHQWLISFPDSEVTVDPGYVSIDDRGLISTGGRKENEEKKKGKTHRIGVRGVEEDSIALPCSPMSSFRLVNEDSKVRNTPGSRRSQSRKSEESGVEEKGERTFSGMDYTIALKRSKAFHRDFHLP